MTEKRTGRKPSEDAKAKARAAETAEVVDLFATRGQGVEDPDAVRPVVGPPAPGKFKGPKTGAPRKRPPRMKTKLSPKISDIQYRIERGEITMKDLVATMTPEELVRGQLMSSAGDFRGRPPAFIPAEFHTECMRELLRRGEDIWRNAYLKSIEVFAKLAADETLDAKDRMKAAQYVIERVAGKTPEKIEVAVAQPWETIIGGIVAEAEDDAIARATRILSGEG